MMIRLRHSVQMALALGTGIDDSLLACLQEQGFYPEKYNYYAVWMIRVSGTADGEAIRSYLEQAFPADTLLLLLKAEGFSMLVAAGNRKRDLIDNKLEEACQLFSIEIGQEMSIFSDGTVFADYRELPNKLQKCARQFTDVTATVSGVHFTERARALSTMISPDEITAILRLFEKGKFDEMDQILDEKVLQIRAGNVLQPASIPPTSIKRFFVELITFAAHTAYDYGVDVDKVMHYEDPYQIIFSKRDTPSIKEWFLNACRQLYDACQKTAAQDRNSLITAVEAYIQSNVSREDFGVAEIAETFHLSPAYLSNCYSSARGTTLIKYISQLRMEIACRYLEQTEEPVSEICKKAGYASINYFYSCFRKKFGQTPAEYRLNAKNHNDF